MSALATRRFCRKIEARWVLAVIGDFVGTRNSSTTSSTTTITPSTSSKPEVITKNISFRRAASSHIPAERRPTVLIYSWLLAKSRHIYRYGDFYLDKGFDVLNIKIEPTQLVWPRRSQVVAKKVVEFLSDGSQKPILMHGFSVGAYMYAETLCFIVSDPVLRREVGGRVKGQILDSPVAVTEIASSFPQALTSNYVLQKVLEGGLTGYLVAFPNSVRKQFFAASDAILSNELKAPTLFLYSRDDPVSPPGPPDECIADWTRRGIPVWGKCWEKSKHVSHLHYYPVDYIAALNDFLHKTGLVTRQEKRDVGDYEIKVDGGDVDQQQMSVVQG